MTTDTAQPSAAQLIKKKARNLGFADCRICAADPPPQEQREALAGWLAAGMHGTMAWFERSADARQDIHARYPWARSIVALRVDYAADRPELPPDSIGPRVARYALAKDYHDVLKEDLERLQHYVARLAEEEVRCGGGVLPTSEDGAHVGAQRAAPSPAEEQRTRHAAPLQGRAGGAPAPQTEALWYMDTGPLLEHVYAQRSGIGWTGKHTLTLNERDGSWFFIAEIVTSLELAPDAPATNHCGTCTACIDACPTGAIIEPYKLDARRCISYLTIEHKGAIEADMRDKLHGLMFGCDICQEVCPYNRKRDERDGQRLPKDEWRAPDTESLTLDNVLLLPDARLAARLVGTPLHRTGAARLKRNAALIVGAQALENHLKGVVHCITHPEPFVRESCAWALGCFGGTAIAAKARQALSTHQKRETDEPVREVVAQALVRLTNSGGNPQE